MSKHIDAAVKVGLVLSLAAVIVLSVLLSRQKDSVVQLQVQLGELELRECEEPARESCSCETDVRLLTACKGSLKMARTEITRASKAMRQQGVASEGAAGTGTEETHEGWASEAPGAVGAQDDEAPRQKVTDLFGGKLGLAPEQMQPLGELVCAAMALRQSLLDDYAYGQAGEEETWHQLTQIRKEVTAQMADVLGPERYKEFRAAGGIGALASVVDCGGPG